MAQFYKKVALKALFMCCYFTVVCCSIFFLISCHFTEDVPLFYKGVFEIYSCVPF